MSSVTFNPVFAGTPPAEQQPDDLKKKYIELLDNFQHENSPHRWRPFEREFESQLLQLPVETVEALYLILKDVFTLYCQNNDRSKIVTALLRVPQDEWRLLLKQVCFIMPVGTGGHDLARAVDILSAVPNHLFREQLLNSANRLFKWDTPTFERGRILQALSRLTLDQIIELDRADQEQRDLFVQKVCLCRNEVD